MFSATEYEYIKGLIENYYNQGYQQYLCITNNPIDYSSTNNTYDIICYYSKDNLSINNNNLNVPSNSIKCEFDSNNYSTNNTIDKLVCNNFNGNVELNTKEYVYSNLNNYSDILGNKLDINNQKTIGLSILAVLLIFSLYKFIRNFI